MTITKHATLFLMTLAGLTGLLNAQMSTTLKAQIPFAFVASGHTMPAGECTIAAVENGPKVLMISCGKQRNYAAAVADESPNAHRKTALVFHRYGDRYFLTAIKHEKGSAYQLPASEAERELLARNVPVQVFTLLASSK